MARSNSAAPPARRGARAGDTLSPVAKEAIALAAARLGGVDRLVEWVKEDPKNEHTFWSSIYPKLMPLQLDGAGENGEHLHGLTVTFVRPAG